MTHLDHYEAQLPGLGLGNYIATSDADPDYNCISWAVGDTSQHWWPVSSPLEPPAHWPDAAPREETLDAFVAAFTTLQYKRCVDGSVESGIEKVAIYAKGGDCTPTHAARQLPSGHWTSKLGAGIDIEHDLDGVCGDTPMAYGTVVVFMARPRQEPLPKPRLQWPAGRPRGRPWPVDLTA